MAHEKTIHDIEVPYGVAGQMVQVAKYYATNRLTDGFTKEKMFKHFSMSSKTYYKWLENESYQKYINEMEHLLLPEDELEAFRKMKLKVMAFADKQSVSSAEIKMFMDFFGYVAKADEKIQSEKLGINKDGTTSTPKSVEEKKNLLLQRLKGTGK
jgi:predicted DNA-binding protein